MLTLNQILAKIEAVGNAHGQINAVSVGPEYDIAADEGVLSYPLLWIMPDGFDIDFQGQDLSYRFFLAVMDREQLDRSNQMEVLSDTALILMDVLNKLHYDERTADMIVNVNDTAQPFIGDKTDLVAGHGITLSVTVPYTRDACAFPS